MSLSEIRERCLKLTREKIRESVSPDLHVINAINNIEELQKVAGSLVKRLREWHSLHLPELDKQVTDNEQYLDLVLADKKQDFIREYKVKDSMGVDLSKEDMSEIMMLARTAREVDAERQRLEAYLEKRMGELCPNVAAVAGPIVGAKLLRGAGSLKDLAMLRSSTIQLIGAEKALFRHIRTGARPPKHGHLMQHPMVQSARRDQRGRIARMLADKISIASRIDYFKGEFAGDRLLKEVEVKTK